MNYVEGDYGTAQTSMMTTYAGNMLSHSRVLSTCLGIYFCREQWKNFKSVLLHNLLSVEIELSTRGSECYSNLIAQFL